MILDSTVDNICIVWGCKHCLLIYISKCYNSTAIILLQEGGANKSTKSISIIIDNQYIIHQLKKLPSSDTDFYLEL